jgi:DNA replication and repair protein RecF
VLVVGRNGAGKTNLLESLHVGTQGFSPRTRSDAHLVRLGTSAARISLRGRHRGLATQVDLTLAPREGKRALLNGARLRTAEQLRTELATLVFTPDRLAVVKGGPAARRAYFDRILGRLWPARATLPAEFGACLAQRNAALRRVSLGLSGRDALAPWTERVVSLGRLLVEARSLTLTTLGPRFAERADELGLADARLVYEGEELTIAELEQRLERDVQRGSTGAGPHLHDVSILAGPRDLRSLGSQGEQRVAVLALLLAESALIEEQRGFAPLLLLDDVLSELDPGRRRSLLERVGSLGQTVITSTTRDALPGEPAQVVEVTPGFARAA